MNSSLQGKKVAVTGAAGSLGEAFVKDLVKLGATVYAISVTRSKLDCLAKAYPTVIPILCDLSKWAESEQLLNETIPDDIDMLVNNSGVARSETIENLTEEGVDDILNVNFKGTLCTTKVVINKLLKRGIGGNIVNISSVTSDYPLSFLLAYGMTKAAVNRLTKTLASQYGPKKIRVNSVNPTYVPGTLMGDTLFDTEEKKALFTDNTPLPSLPTHQDISNAVMFLLSEKAESITGQIMFVDAGIRRT